MNARNSLRMTALAAIFALAGPVLGAADDAPKQDTRDSQTRLARYVPHQLDDQRLSEVGGAARAPHKDTVGNDLSEIQRFIRWMIVLRI